MDASVPTPDPSAQAPLPDDVPTLQAMVRQLMAEIQRLRAENAQLQSKLDAALKHRFGQRRERRQSPPKNSCYKSPGKRDKHGRAVLPEHLERREVIHDLTEAEKVCPCCGKPRICIGQQTAEQLDMEPVRFFVRRTIKKTYTCPDCQPKAPPEQPCIQTAGPPEVGPLARALCGPGLLAHAITAKYADHVPLHRLSGQLARSGVEISCSTLGDWMASAATLLEPLVLLMKRRILLSRVIHSDDTHVKLRVPGKDRTDKAHLWVYIGEAEHPYVVFDFTTDYRAASGPAEFLKGYTGYLQADALAQYECLFGPEAVKHVCCMAHARRKFVAALEAKAETAQQALDLIGKLYEIERQLPALLAPSTDEKEQKECRQREEQRQQIRQQQAEPVLEELKRWLEGAARQALPKSVLGKAVGYAQNNWEALKRYLEQGYLVIDNNLSERTLRAIALGRNNWGVIGSEKGGATAAILYSVVSSCKHLGVDPFAYLRECLPGLFALGEKPTTEPLTEWLPDQWLARQNAKPKGLAAPSG
jgi:transposase